MSDNGYTPSFERVRDLYSWAYAWRTEDHDDDTDLSSLRERNRAEFDRAIAEHDRQVAERAWEQGLDDTRVTMLRRAGTYEADIDILAMENPYRVVPLAPAEGVDR